MGRGIRVKKFLTVILILLFSVTASARGLMTFGGGTPVAAGGGWALGQNATVWEDCEDSSLQSGFTTSGTVTYGDTDGEFNSANDGGVGGAEISLTGSTHAVNYQLNDDSISIGFWLKTPTVGNVNPGTIYSFATATGFGGNHNLTIQLYCDFCGGAPSVIMYGDGNVTHTTLASNTWYWFAIKAVAGGTSSLRVYDSTGTPLEVADSTITACGYDADYHSIGALNWNLSGEDLRIDDVIIYADGTWPLDPI